MRKKRRTQPRYRLLKASCVGAGLLSISNPTQVTAADIGLYDVHNDQSLGSIPNPFPTAPLGVHVAVGDVDGDGLGDIIMGPGSGAAEFAVATGKNIRKPPRNTLSFASGLLSPAAGVRVATGDVDGDDIDEIILTPATGPGSEARRIKAKVPALTGEAEDFYVVDSTDGLFEGFAGGANVAIGDYEGNGLPDIVAARAGYGGRHICKWEQTFATATDFETPHPDSSGGLQIAMGDIDGDGADEILTLPNSSSDGLPHAAVTDHKNGDFVEILSFNEPAGVHVALGDLDGDGRADLVVGSARGFDPYIKLYSLNIEDPLKLYALEKDPLRLADTDFSDPAFRGGVRVAVGDINGDGFADIAFAPAGVPEPATIVSLFTGLGAWLFGSRRRRRHEAPG